MFDISVSLKKSIFSDVTLSLSALSLTCVSDSSPDMYSTSPCFARFEHTCIINVDFPIPGSPPIKFNEPSTIPPPNTLFNSS